MVIGGSWADQVHLACNSTQSINKCTGPISTRLVNELTKSDTSQSIAHPYYIKWRQPFIQHILPAVERKELEDKQVYDPVREQLDPLLATRHS